LFGCKDGVPTFNYAIEQAVAESYLLNYRVLEAQTRFRISGIQGDQLPLPLQQAIADEGVDIEELNSELMSISQPCTFADASVCAIEPPPGFEVLATEVSANRLYGFEQFILQST
jgi:hypothetical protein